MRRSTIQPSEPTLDTPKITGNYTNDCSDIELYDGSELRAICNGGGGVVAPLDLNLCVGINPYWKSLDWLPM